MPYRRWASPDKVYPFRHLAIHALQAGWACPTKYTHSGILQFMPYRRAGFARQSIKKLGGKMKDLTLFGMPIALDEETGKLVSSSSDIRWEDYSRKYSDKMEGLLADPDYKKTDDPYYDFYKAIVSDKTRTAFSDVALRYDSTVILPGYAGKRM